MEWDDLRYVLAVAMRARLQARRAISASIIRRCSGVISAFEKQLGLRLFERLPTGYVLTAGGEELIAAARHIDDTVTGSSASLPARISGCPAPFASRPPTRLDGIDPAGNPGGVSRRRIRASASRSRSPMLMFNLTKRDADVAIRPANDPPETLIGRRIAKIAFAIYASPRYLASSGKMKAPPASRWVGPDDSLAANVGRAVDARGTAGQRDQRCASNSLLGLRQAAQAGLGLAALPCYLGDTSPDLVCVHAPIAAMETALWILTHEDLRHTARVHGFTEFAANAFGRHRPLLGRKLARVGSK